MTKKSVTQAVTNLVEELSDFTPDERRRIVQASLTLLGDVPTVLDEKTDVVGGEGDYPVKARMWMKQHDLTPDSIDQVFHRGDSGTEIIAAIPGATRREQVRNAYVLSGIAQLLASGETRFEDKAARQICEKGGFFDHTNHSKYMKGSEFAGSKEKGWVLTTPGLKQGASLVAELSKDR